MNKQTILKVACILVFLSLAFRPVVAYTQVQAPSSPSMVQSGTSDYAQGKIDAERDAHGNALWILGGFCCGIFGVAGAYFIKPDVPTQAIIGKSSEYVMGYSEAYKDKGRNKNTWYAVGGCLVSAVISLIYDATAATTTSTTTY